MQSASDFTLLRWTSDLVKAYERLQGLIATNEADPPEDEQIAFFNVAAARISSEVSSLAKTDKLAAPVRATR